MAVAHGLCPRLVTDLAEAKHHYANTLGLCLDPRRGRQGLLQGLGRMGPPLVVLEEGGVGVVKFGFKVEYSTDIDHREEAPRTSA